MTIAKKYLAECEEALKKIKTYEELSENDETIQTLVRVGAFLFSKPLDLMTEDVLKDMGVDLAGAYGFVGQKSARARAERDVYEAKLEDIKGQLVLDYLSDGEYKVTQAKAKASDDIAELKYFVIEKETLKNQWEAMEKANATMIMFIQSMLRIKEKERGQNNFQS